MAFVLLPSWSWAQDIDEAAYSLQARKYHLKHEVYIAPGLLPLDAYEKGVIGNISYTYHLNEGWAVEVAQFAYVYNVDTGLKKDLQNFGWNPVGRKTLQYYGSVNAVFKPIYRKMILFNRTILHGETFFVLGGGPFRVKSEVLNAASFKPAIDFGVGFRIYLNDWASLRLDARDYIWFDGWNPNNVLMLALGISLNYSGD